MRQPEDGSTYQAGGIRILSEDDAGSARRENIFALQVRGAHETRDSAILMACQFSLELHTLSATSGRRSAAQWITQSGAYDAKVASVFFASVKSTGSRSSVGRECDSPFTKDVQIIYEKYVSFRNHNSRMNGFAYNARTSTERLGWEHSYTRWDRMEKLLFTSNSRHGFESFVNGSTQDATSTFGRKIFTTNRLSMIARERTEALLGCTSHKYVRHRIYAMQARA